MKKPKAIENDLLAPQLREGQIDHLGDPLSQFEACIDFKARVCDHLSPRRRWFGFWS